MQKENLPKIVYIGWTEPSDASGATLALMRHLFADNLWDVLVITDKPYKGVGKESQWINVKRSWLHHRLSRTRFRRLIAQYEMVVEPYFIAAKIRDVVSSFQPDVIFSVPDNTLSWVAKLVSSRLNIPLISNFQDWWPRGQFYSQNEAPYLPIRSILEERLRHIYKHSRIAFCTSEGFRNFLGDHPCAPILYPCPGKQTSLRPSIKYVENKEPINLIYAGTTVRYYGQKLLSLAKVVADREDIIFHIYGGKPDWSIQDIKWAEDVGIYKGFVKHEVVKQHIMNAHIGLIVMTSAPELEVMMRTSFTTKFLEYTQLAKPVIVWGPAYCEPVRVARLTMSGLVNDTEDPKSVLSSLEIFRDQSILKQYSDNAWELANNTFDSEKIQHIFSNNIYKLIQNTQ
ncbi:glycosyltransferase family 4 protein [Tolypothrix sp. PCC 7910]|uniref:glycosyltransferase family 4 protein n=1 Tax=Tolypothrix sp. PCC 7910 TaxID=2099387 RepID=UPI00142799E7|nr:glycosyltransferase family 4 protein [Tolypothrix sp. PCC 7910]QIR37990.1 glycosyltransferase family 4 protein [Tolypothrix sp. PCC 7910]